MRSGQMLLGLGLSSRRAAARWKISDHVLLQRSPGQRALHRGDHRSGRQRSETMTRILVLPALCGCLWSAGIPEAPRNVIVHKEAGRFGGWPANNGIWSWGDEIVVGFKLG